VLIAYLVANLLYFSKSEVGINLVRGHTGRWFPLGDWMWQRTLDRPFVDDGDQPKVKTAAKARHSAKKTESKKPSKHDCELLGPGERP